MPAYENGRLGAAHGFDEPFVFGSLDNMPLAADDPHARELSRSMMRSLVDFARSGSTGWHPYSTADHGIKRWA